MKNFIRYSIFLTGFILSAFLLAACGNLSLAADITPPPDYHPPTEPQPVAAGPSYPLVAPDPSAGAPIFAEKCVPCHGPTGQGDGPQASKLPNPVIAIGDPKVARDASPSSWYTVITQGRLERFMPGFSGSLSDRQRWDVLAYVFTLSNPPDQVTQGKAIYADQCASCHGDQGKGDGPQAASLADKPQDLTAPGGLTQQTASQMFQAIQNGAKSMPAFAGKLNENQAWAITSFLRSLTFASVPAASQAAAYPAPAAVAANNDQTATPQPTQEAGATAQVTPSQPEGATPPGAPETPQGAPETPQGTPRTQAVQATLQGTPGTPQANPIGTVRGQVNAPQGITVPPGLNVTLFGYDANMQMVLNKVGPLNPDETFTFENVEMPSNWVYMATIDINNMTFNSDVVHAQAGVLEIQLPISVYDTTTDKSQLVVDRMHIFFDFTQPDAVQVVELFIISNPTQHVVVPAKAGQPLINFALPPGATNLQFQDGALGQRYIQTETGFGDTQSIQPGNGQHQILFAFDLPYQNKLSLAIPAPLPVTAVVVMVPTSGVKVQSPDLQDSGQRDVQNMTFQVYSGGNIPVGKSVSMTVSGKPDLTQASAAGSKTGSTTGILIGGGIFAVALVGSGLWLFRRRRANLASKSAGEAAEEVVLDDSDALIDAIAALDDLYKAGDLPETAYQQRRAELKERLKASYLAESTGKDVA